MARGRSEDWRLRVTRRTRPLAAERRSWISDRFLSANPELTAATQPFGSAELERRHYERIEQLAERLQGGTLSAAGYGSQRDRLDQLHDHLYSGLHIQQRR